MKFTHLSLEDLQGMERIPRLNLINSVSGAKSANLIGTADKAGNSNLAIFSSVTHLGSDPALLGLVMRPIVGERHTYDNIVSTGYYTINQVHQDIKERAHFTGAAFEKAESEFTACGLTEQWLSNHEAPYVRESRLTMGMRLVDNLPIEANGCRLIIGAIEHLYFEGDVQRSDGSLDQTALETVCITGLDHYHTIPVGTVFPYPRVTNLPNFGVHTHRPDSVVYDEKNGGYNASLLPYATSVGGPAFTTNDLSVWKNNSVSKVSAHFKTRFDEIKGEYQAMVDQYNWNEIVYTAKFRFEPIVGEPYHLYERDNGERFLSPIPPDSWKLNCLGSFLLNTDRMWMKVDEGTI